jgi:hypothetical protein
MNIGWKPFKSKTFTTTFAIATTIDIRRSPSY